MPDLGGLSVVSFGFLIVMPVISLVLLGVCWLIGDLGIVVKSAFTVVFLASFGLLLTKVPQTFTVVHVVLALVIGFATFFTYWVPPSKGRGRGIVR
jgi:hypothetical protein